MIGGILFLVLGLIVGLISGVVGIGGGIFFVPILVYLFHMSEHEAQGTTLALLVPPIGFLAAWVYYKHGYVNLKIAALAAAGFFLGGLLGAKTAVGLPEHALKRIFGAVLLLVGIKMFFSK